ncbi:PEP-CTERM sorting domain-containing protein [Desulfohalovibrio reitneri]|uniref:PEP-CTERM sorting domain-containing protein n=1 Tax=Desulfohalovibrio reitneri TaxID=1307759 RepID=UPI0004A76FD5|nr:PEP-CTERM sorting domain-containing protein [Desulfohalovibrio reitneri]
MKNIIQRIHKASNRLLLVLTLVGCLVLLAVFASAFSGGASPAALLGFDFKERVDKRVQSAPKPAVKAGGVQHAEFPGDSLVQNWRQGRFLPDDGVSYAGSMASWFGMGSANAHGFRLGGGGTPPQPRLGSNSLANGPRAASFGPTLSMAGGGFSGGGSGGGSGGSGGGSGDGEIGELALIPQELQNPGKNPFDYPWYEQPRDYPVAAAPEPGTGILLGAAAVVGLAALRRKRNKA